MKNLFFIMIILLLWGCDTLTNITGDDDDDTGIGPIEFIPLCSYKSPQWSGDGSRIAYAKYMADGNSGIYLIDTTGSNNTLLNNTKGYPFFEFSWSEDGEWFAAVGSQNKITLFNINGVTTKTITKSNTADYFFYPEISNDGSTVLYTYMDTDPTSPTHCIYKINTDGSNKISIFDRDNYESIQGMGHMNFNFGSSLITLTVFEPGAENILIIDTLGNIVKRVTNSPNTHMARRGPKLSPDNSTILFTCSQSGFDNNGEYIYASPALMDTNGENVRFLTNYYSEQAEWSPDGKKIVLMDHRNNDLVIIDTEGNELKRLFNN